MKVKENFLNEKKTNREKLMWSFDLTISLETRSYFCTAQEVRQSWQFILHFYEKKQVPNMQSHIRNFFSKANLSNSPGSDIPWPLNVLVLVSLGRVSHSGQGQPLLMTSLGIPSRSYESRDIKSAADCAAHGGTWESPCSKLRTAVTCTEPSITQQKA